MNDKDQLWKLKRYYEKVLIDYYSTNEIDPDMANRIVGGLTRFMNITEQQQQEIRKLQQQLQQAQAKIERCKEIFKDIRDASSDIYALRKAEQALQTLEGAK